jgi:hypothetical protein
MAILKQLRGLIRTWMANYFISLKALVALYLAIHIRMDGS